MSDLHIYCETGAIGDIAISICRSHIAMEAWGHTKTIIHTSPIFRYGNPPQDKPYNSDCITILQHCNFIKDIVFECEHDKPETIQISKKYKCQITQPIIYREKQNILDWINLKNFLPKEEFKGKVAIFHPVSLANKPSKHLDDYIPEWDRCIKTLIQNGFTIVMVGGENDPIHLTMKKTTIEKINNKIGLWSQLESLAFLLYRADVVVSCDSWGAIWGPAARIPSAIAWGYRMENNIDWWVTGFIGNKDCYKYSWSSQKDYCDVDLANYLGRLNIKERHV